METRMLKSIIFIIIIFPFGAEAFSGRSNTSPVKLEDSGPIVISDPKPISELTETTTKPLLIAASCLKFVYPKKSYKLKEEGEVRLKLSISSSGRVVGSVLVSTSGSNYLDEETARIFKSCSFRSAVTKEGKKIESSIQVKHRWNLSKDIPPLKAP
jgi:TonB family protein